MAPSRKRRASSKQSLQKKSRLAEEEGNPQLEFWLNAQESCDVKLSIVPHHQLHTQKHSPPALLVYASSQLLSRIPYFATSLSEPWRMNLSDTHPDIHNEKRALTLECTASTSPSDYHLCMQFLMQNKIYFSSVDEALDMVRAADHLLFNECVDACMAYLVMAPWSVNDYEAVQHAMSSLGVRPSPDLAVKLMPLENTDVFKDVLLHLLRKNSITAFLGQTFLNAPPELAQLLTPALMEAWTSLSRDPCLYEAMDAWIDLSNALLLQGAIAKELQKAFVSVSPSLSRGLYNSRTPNSAVKILNQFFSRALPSTSDYYEVALGLSCVQRAELLFAWARVVNKLQNEDLNRAFKKLFCTLPPQEPVLVQLVKEHHKESFFKPCLEWWNTSLIARMKPSPSANKEIHADE